MQERLRNVIKKNALLIGILIGYYFFNRLTHISIPCFFKLISGFECPGCGITRCLFSILELDFKKAFNYNQLVFIMLPFFTIYYIYKTYMYIVNKKEKIIISDSFRILLLIIVIIFGIIRNIPFFKL